MENANPLSGVDLPDSLNFPSPTLPAATAAPHAEVGDRWGIKVFADEGRVVIDVPPLGWRPALRAFKPAAVCTAVVFALAGAMKAGLRTWPWLDVTLVTLVAIGGVAAIITTAFGIAVAARRTFDATVFQVTPDEFVLRRHDGERITGWYERRWPRALVGDIKDDLPGMGLMIQIVGKARLQLLDDHPPEARRWVAERLREALGRAAPRPGGQGDLV